MTKLDLLKAMRQDAKYNESNAEDRKEREFYNNIIQELDKELAEERIRIMNIKH